MPAGAKRYLRLDAEAGEAEGGRPGPESLRSRARAALALLPLPLFLLLSLAALPDFAQLPPLPPSLRAFLGFGPSPGQISLALLVYALAATLLTYRRLAGGLRPEGGFSGLAYLAAFYGFYHFAGGTLENRLAVFLAGLTVLGLDAGNAWLWYRRRARRRADGPEATLRT